MSVLRDLFASEKGVIAIVLIIAATVLAAIGRLEVSAWISYTEIIYAAFAAGTGLRAIGIGLGQRGQTPPKGDS